MGSRPVSPVRSRALAAGLDQLVRRGLRGVWVRGDLVPSPAIWAANHHSWWDGFVTAAVLSRHQRAASLLMDAGNLAQYRFLRSMGVISAQRPRQALEALRGGRILIIFPEARLRPLGPLGPLAPGAAWFARQAPAPVMPVAIRLAMRGHQHPEALVDLGAPCDPHALAEALGSRLSQLDRDLAAADPRQPVPGFRRVVAGRVSWDERISAWSVRRGC